MSKRNPGQTSPRVSSIAGKVLANGGKATNSQGKTLAASALRQDIKPSGKKK